MDRHKYLSIIICLLIGLVILTFPFGVSCSQSTPSPTTAKTPVPPTQASTNATKLTFANWSAPPNQQAYTVEQWAKDFEQKTGGRYTVEVVHGGVIANPGDSYDAVVKGIADIASFVPKESDYPFQMVTLPPDLPIGWMTCETATKAYYKLFKEGYFDKEFANVKLLFLHCGNTEDVSTKEPVNSIQDFKGMKLVVPGGTSVDIAQAVGAVVVTGGPPDAYELVQKGVAEGMYIAGLGYFEFQWVDLVKYRILPMQLSKATHAYAMNKAVYSKMPEDVKAIVDEMVADTQYGLSVAKGWDKWYDESVAYFHEKGGQDIDWSEAEKAKLNDVIYPIWEKWLGQTGEEGKKALTAFYNYLKADGIENPTPGWSP